MRYDLVVPLSDSIPLVVSAIVGSAGIASAVARVTQLSEPSRIRKRLESSLALLAKMPGGPAKDAVLLTYERDAARLAAIVLVQRSLTFSRSVGLLISSLVVTALIFGAGSYFYYNVGDEKSAFYEGWFRSLVPSFITISALVAAVIIFISTNHAVALQRRRSTMSDDLFVAGEVNAELIRTQIDDYRN